MASSFDYYMLTEIFFVVFIKYTPFMKFGASPWLSG